MCACNIRVDPTTYSNRGFPPYFEKRLHSLTNQVLFLLIVCLSKELITFALAVFFENVMYALSVTCCDDTTFYEMRRAFYKMKRAHLNF